MIAQFIGLFVVILIGISLLPTITEQVKVAEASANLTATNNQWATTILDMTPMLFVIAILGAGVAIAYSAFRTIPEFGEGDYEDTRTDEEKMLDKLKEGNEDEEIKKEIDEDYKQPINKQKYIKMEAVIDSIPLNDKNLKDKSNSFDKTKYD